jgi:glutamine synthetase
LDVYLEQYCKTVRSEGMQTLEMAKTLLFPAAIRYQNELASTCANLKLVGYEFDTDTLDKITELVKHLQDSCSLLDKVVHEHDHANLLAEAQHFADEVLPAMASVRKYADELEGWVADDLWPLPTYQEMLFIK